MSCACDARAAGAPACAICSAGSDDELLQALVSGASALPHRGREPRSDTRRVSVLGRALEGPWSPRGRPNPQPPVGPNAEVELGGASGMPSVSDCDTSEYEENPAPRAPGGRRWSLQLVRPADALEAARGRPRPPASAAARPAHPTHVSSQVTASDHTPPVSLSSLVISAEIPASAIWEGRGSGGDTAGPSGAGPPGEGGHRIEGRSSGDFKRGSVVSKVTPAMIASSGFFQSEGPRGPPGGPPAAPPAAPPRGGRSSLESKLGAQRGSVEYGTVALTSDDPVASRGSAPFIQRATSRRPRGPVI